MPLACRRLSLVGVADLVEFHKGADGDTPYPIEYKRGKPKPRRADEAQLCAQTLCLEEMIWPSRVRRRAVLWRENANFGYLQRANLEWKWGPEASARSESLSGLRPARAVFFVRGRGGSCAMDGLARGWRQL